MFGGLGFRVQGFGLWYCNEYIDKGMVIYQRFGGIWYCNEYNHKGMELYQQKVILGGCFIVEPFHSNNQ